EVIGDIPERSDYERGTNAHKPSILLFDKVIIAGLYLHEEECDGVFRLEGVSPVLMTGKVYPICYRGNLQDGRVTKIRKELYCYPTTVKNDDYFTPVIYSGL